MRLRLDEEQQLIGQSARRLLEGFPIEDRRKGWGGQWPRAAWAALAQAGLLEPALGTGRMEQPTATLMVIATEIGRACLVSPFIASVTACGHLLASLGDEAAALSLAEGTRIAAFATEEATFADGLLRPATQWRDGVLRGEKRSVSFVGDADMLLVTARDAQGQPVLLRVDPAAPGVTMRKLGSVNGEPLFDLAFETPIGAESVCGSGQELTDALTATLAHVFAVQSALLVGGAERALEIVSEHVKIREQFDQPLGAFQAVKHHIANSRLSLDAARLMLFELAWRMDRGDDVILAHAAETKLWIAQATGEILRRAHELQGGISVVDMHETMLLYRRNLADSLLWGSPTEILPLTYPLRTLRPTVQPLADI